MKKATGYDYISGKLLYKTHGELSVTVTNISNTCIPRGEFPAVLKRAELTPNPTPHTQKKRKKEKKKTWLKKIHRPGSVHTALFKIYESSLNDQLYQHCIIILNAFLSVYREWYICQSLLVKVINEKVSSQNPYHWGFLCFCLRRLTAFPNL